MAAESLAWPSPDDFVTGLEDDERVLPRFCDNLALPRLSHDETVDLLVSRRPTILAYARKFVHDLDDAEDVAQEAIVAAWKALSQFRGESSLETWVYPIVKHCAERFLEKKRRHREVLAAWAAEQENAEESALEKSPESLLAEDEQIRALWLLVASQPSNYREVLVEHYLFSRTCESIARESGVPLNTVTTRLRRARNLLKRYIAESTLDVNNLPLVFRADAVEWWDWQDAIDFNTRRLPGHIPLIGLDG